MVDTDQEKEAQSILSAKSRNHSVEEKEEEKERKKEKRKKKIEKMNLSCMNWRKLFWSCILQNGVPSLGVL